mgnify:CR=1 FL=1
MKIAFITTAAVCAMAFASGPVAALETIPVLDLDIASRMAAGCEAKAVAEGWRMNIAIVDRGADLVVFHRMDNAFLGSGAIAISKATTSARFPFSTRAVEGLAYGSGDTAASIPGFSAVDGVIAFAGGLPIMAGGVQIGGVGVSGDTADHDEACAQAALDAVAGDLN